MDREVQYLINNIAKEIIRAFDIAIPICDIDEVVQKLGGSIQVDSRLFECKVVKRGKGFRIIMPLFQNEQYRRFAIAQELGHLFLHMGYLTNTKLWDKQLDNTRFGLSTAEQSYQSNEFAMAFLMPRAEYKKILEENSVGTMVKTKNVAEYFGVRIAIASLRGQSLGYLK